MNKETPTARALIDLMNLNLQHAKVQAFALFNIGRITEQQLTRMEGSIRDAGNVISKILDEKQGS